MGGRLQKKLYLSFHPQRRNDIPVKNSADNYYPSRQSYGPFESAQHSLYRRLLPDRNSPSSPPPSRECIRLSPIFRYSDTPEITCRIRTASAELSSNRNFAVGHGRLAKLLGGNIATTRNRIPNVSSGVRLGQRLHTAQKLLGGFEASAVRITKSRRRFHRPETSHVPSIYWAAETSGICTSSRLDSGCVGKCVRSSSFGFNRSQQKQLSTRRLPKDIRKPFGWWISQTIQAVTGPSSGFYLGRGRGNLL